MAGGDEAGKLGRGPSWAPVLRNTAVAGPPGVPVRKEPGARKA